MYEYSGWFGMITQAHKSKKNVITPRPDHSFYLCFLGRWTRFQSLFTFSTSECLERPKKYSKNHAICILFRVLPKSPDDLWSKWLLKWIQWPKTHKMSGLVGGLEHFLFWVCLHLSQSHKKSSSTPIRPLNLHIFSAAESTSPKSV